MNTEPIKSGTVKLNNQLAKVVAVELFAQFDPDGIWKIIGNLKRIRLRFSRQTVIEKQVAKARGEKECRQTACDYNRFS